MNVECFYVKLLNHCFLRLLSFVQQENWHSKFRVLHFNMDETLKSEVCAFTEVRQRDLKFVNLKEVTQFMLYTHFVHNLCIKMVLLGNIYLLHQ